MGNSINKIFSETKPNGRYVTYLQSVRIQLGVTPGDAKPDSKGIKNPH